MFWMNDSRKKLIELIGVITCPNTICNFCEHFKNKSACEKHKKEVSADHLIANGVTMQKEAKLYWKMVEENHGELTCSACDSHLGCREDAKFCPECGAKFIINEVRPPKEIEYGCL